MPISSAGSRGVGKTSCAHFLPKLSTAPTAPPPAKRATSVIRVGNSTKAQPQYHRARRGKQQRCRRHPRPHRAGVRAPTQGRYRVFIIDEVHMLSNAAFNSFLKTLEEPPGYVIFILATTENTRLYLLSFRAVRSTTSTVYQSTIWCTICSTWQQAKASAPNEALNVIARKADGAMRDALSIFRPGGGLHAGQYHIRGPQSRTSTCSTKATTTACSMHS